ncbi:MAG TPA: alpha/beta fold hydrolase, partial [Acidimicrobiia bacterium]|nr:alpha/beta fold hydrolase [Acidimicrobiia bacterium]
MHETFDSDGLRLASHLSRPPGFARVPGLILCHGFPTGPRGGDSSASTYPELAERLTRETGWAAMAFNFRGTGGSEGDFSLEGWLSDLRNAVSVMSERPDVGGVWIAGSSTGGSLAIILAADDERVRGVATLAAPASFSDWALHPDRLLADSRALGIIRHAEFPPDQKAWGQQFAQLSPLEAAARIAPRPLLLIHGEADEVVPVADARALYEAGFGTADLR